MITTLLSFFGNLFSFLGKGLDFLDKRKFENEVKNNYENKKKIDALEDDKKSKELIDESNEKTEKARKAINEVKNDLNSDLEIRGLILTQYDIRTSLSIDSREQLEKYFESKISETPQISEK